MNYRYTVKVQLYRYDLDMESHLVVGKEVIKDAESRSYALQTAEVLYKRAKDAAEAV